MPRWSPPHWLSFRKVSMAASAAAILTGCLTLVGWLFDLPALRSPIAGQVAMNPLTALAFLMAGLALALLLQTDRPSARRGGQIAAALVAGMGLVKLLDYLLNWDLGLDRLLFAAALGDNRVAPNTALNFLLNGLALLLLDTETRRGYRPGPVLAFVALLLALVAVIGYAYGVTPFYGIASYIPMALNTALAFTVLGIGILCARPGRGLANVLTSPRTGGFLVRRLLPAAFAVPVLLGWFHLLGERERIFDMESGAALLAVANVVIFAFVVLLTGRALNRIDRAREQAEQALLHERHLLHSLMDHIPDSIYFKDTAGHFTRINRALANRLGLRDPADAVGKTDFDFFTEEHARPALEDEQAVMQSAEALVGKEEQETWPDGRRHWILTTKLPLADPAGTVVGTFGISRDITRRKAAEMAQREAEERMRSLLESTGEGIYGVDLEGRCTFINPAAAEMLGFSPQEVLGQNVHALAHNRKPDGSPYPAEECPICRTFGTGEPCRVEDEVFWRRDGTALPVEYASHPIRAGGEIRGAVVAFTDITERHRLRALLLRSEKLASIGLLSAGVAHEINNPLAYVANNLAVLERDVKGLVGVLDVYEKAHESLAQVDPDSARRARELAEEADLGYVRDNLERLLRRTRDGVERVTRIVGSMRSLARSGPTALDDVSLPDVIENGIELVRGRFQRHGVALEKDYRPVPRIRCAAAQIGQVILNLLVNALQAVEATGKTAEGRVSVRCRPAPGGVAVEVADNGCGIDACDLARIFDPFFTTKPVGEGTGLGLAITHSIVAGHGGRVEVESRPGEGSCFRVVLPLDPKRACLENAG